VLVTHTLLVLRSFDLLCTMVVCFACSQLLPFHFQHLNNVLSSINIPSHCAVLINPSCMASNPLSSPAFTETMSHFRIVYICAFVVVVYMVAVVLVGALTQTSPFV